MSIFKAYEVDNSMATRGMWADLGEDGGKWLLAYAGAENKDFQKAIELAMRPIRVAFDLDAAPTDRVRKVSQGVWAKHIVLGWEGVKDDSEIDIPFSAENVLMVWERAPAIWIRIIRIANDHNNFLKSLLDVARKN